MQELEEILEEIENERTDIDDYSDAKGRMLARHWNSCIDVAEEILRKHVNDGWIPVEERLPEPGTKVLATIKHHEWISDYESGWVPDEEKVRHPEYTEVCEVYGGDSGIWTYICEETGFQEDEAYIKPGKNIARPISEIIAWRPLPEPYRPERSEE